MSDDYTLSKAERDNLIKYDFVPVYSDDDIEKFIPALLAGAKALGGKMLASGAGKAAMSAGKNIAAGAMKHGGKALQAGKKVAVAGKDKLVQGAGKVAETSKKVAGKAGQMRESAQGSKFGQAVSSVNDKIKETMAERAKAAASGGGGGSSDASQSPASSAIQGAMAINAGNAQAKQAQEQRAMDMARRGATIQTGEPMNMAWRMLKGE